MSQENRGESLVAILDELSELVSSARSMPMSASALVNRAEMTELVESARSVLPEQISRADGVVADADAVLERAHAEARRILAEAHREADSLVSQEAVVAEANLRAEQIQREAEASAARLAQDADDWCDRQLAQFEIDLGAVEGQVTAGRARLQERGRARAAEAEMTTDQSHPSKGRK